MKVAAIYGSTSPSCDMLNLYDRSTLIARIHDQLWIQHVLGPQSGIDIFAERALIDIRLDRSEIGHGCAESRSF